MKRSLRTIALTGALMLAVGMAVNVATAQTIGYADAIKILAASCGADIQKYCSKANLGNNGIQSCLQAHAANVSAQCKSDYARVSDLIARRSAAQEAAPKACRADIARLCAGVRRDTGYTLQCLLNKRRLGKRCGQAIVDAGWAK